MIHILIGYVADLLFGDPYFIPHPICLIGKCISKTEAFLRKFVKNSEDEKRLGIFLTMVIVGATYGITFSIVFLAKYINIYLGYAVEGFLIFQILASKSLDKESRKVLNALEKNDILEARKYLSYIVGRETSHLNEKEIIRATVETVAENASDGVIAPLFYIFIGGAPLGMAYKAANTLDSMVGYKNEKYIHFGWASAKFDDLLNYIPARLTAIFMIIGSFYLFYDYKSAIKIVRRDHKNHKSPNCGYPEAATAGALNIQLGGTNTYFGQEIYKPTIGDEIYSLEEEHIKKSIKIMYASSVVGFLVFYFMFA
ncbi:adenosylcobinamide-phosphate synthase CbiB [Inediibacterium massiliense]|uniref:adenosylcobinamide-phosphate synthase CbiB n=1 Tax=Inediibacterium massiliense TaxID=1658111 RepID=UPI0006B5FCCA|nr:adenosylcobinamide-phosphate synthase CbiB [Inediibacterium massiliense]